MQRFIDHSYIASTIFFTVFSQIIMRWQISLAGPLPSDMTGKLTFIGGLFLNPWIIISIFATLMAGVSWMLAMTKFEISYAYPWIGLNFVFMLFLGSVFFGESISSLKIIGTFLVVLGIFVIAKA